MLDIHAYPHVIEPFEHQRAHFLEHATTSSWGLLWEQGTAKTKPIIDTAAYLHQRGDIDGLIVVAPPGVERNWKSDEIPKHLPAEFALDWRSEIFKTEKKHTKNHQRLMEQLLLHPGLAVLLISYDAFMTKEGKAFVWKFLQKRRCLYVLDEAHNIKSPGAKRTKSILASAKYAPFRRILTGTPIAQGPFDIYSQIKFLDEYFWKNKGIHGFVEFKQEFAIFLTREMHLKEFGWDPGYDKLMEYQNLDVLNRWLKQITDRVVKDDVLDLPPKLYSKRYFSMSREQEVAYNQLRRELMLEIDGHIVDATLPIVKILRLQQIACNYVPVDDGEPVHMFSKKNPRMEVMEEIRDGTHRPAIVWARFRHDIDQLLDLLGRDAVRYDGSIDSDEAERNKLAFQRGDAKWFVGNAQKGGSGLTLTQAKSTVYYSNGYRLIDRLQSEDRNHRGGMDNDSVLYTDIIAEGTVDEGIVTNLREKRDIAVEVQGDTWKEWI